MFEIGYNIADDLPEEFSAYEKEVKQLTVGNTGKTGSLVIVLERDTQTDKTVASDLFSTIPLLVQRTLYIEESFPEMAYVYIMSPSGGILQGDRLKIDIKLKNNAQAHITTQAANKIYSMNANYATQIIDLSVDDNCYVEFIPDALIPYRSSRFYQRVN
ncbi:MAG: urease accessory protein UreD, partial [Nitrososphaerales archaeon]